MGRGGGPAEPSNGEQMNSRSTNNLDWSEASLAGVNCSREMVYSSLTRLGNLF